MSDGSGREKAGQPAQRRGTRIRVERDVALLLSDGRRLPARLLDVSSGGFRVSCSADELLAGDLVHLLDGREMLPASIRWVIGEEAGGIFLSAPTLPE